MRFLAILILMLVFPALHSENQASGKIVPFQTVEKPPVFPGCENESRDYTLKKVS